LIYFDADTQRKALAKVADLLAFDGFLFVGAAEQPLVLDKGFVSAHLPMAFACRKGSASLEPAPSSSAAMMETAVSPRLHPTIVDENVAIKPEEQSDLEAAKSLADKGRLEEAARICETYLRTKEPSAQAYYLMGLVRDANGDPSALDYYRKALYLEPNHYDTLLQMAMWSQKNGQTAIAHRFKIRAQRVKTRATKLER
jgi:chemotaxis protein methyltransferase WspC